MYGFQMGRSNWCSDRDRVYVVTRVKPEGAVRMYVICEYVQNRTFWRQTLCLLTMDVPTFSVRQGATRQLGTLSFDGAFVMSLDTGPLRRIQEQIYHSGVNWGLILIYLLTEIGFTPGGSSTVHIYTQTVDRQNNAVKHNTQNGTYVTIRICNLQN